jgi:hypothetical protein
VDRVITPTFLAGIGFRLLGLGELRGVRGLDTRVLGCFWGIILYIADSKAKTKATAKENAEAQRTQRNAEKATALTQ